MELKDILANHSSRISQGEPHRWRQTTNHIDKEVEKNKRNKRIEKT